MMAKFYLLTLFYFVFACARAEIPETIEDMEASHKACLDIKFDSINCSRIFYFQMDSMLNIVFNTVKGEVSSDEKASFMKEQLSWSAKKDIFFRKQDENFAYNIQDGTWKKDMIRVPYEEKAAYLLKRIKVLLKKLIQ